MALTPNPTLGRFLLVWGPPVTSLENLTCNKETTHLCHSHPWVNIVSYYVNRKHASSRVHYYYTALMSPDQDFCTACCIICTAYVRTRHTAQNCTWYAKANPDHSKYEDWSAKCVSLCVLWVSAKRIINFFTTLASSLVCNKRNCMQTFDQIFCK